MSDVSRETCCKRPWRLWTKADLRVLKRLHRTDRTIEEIAETLGRKPGTVRSKISRLGWGGRYTKPTKWIKS